MSVTLRPNLLILVSHPIQYFSPVYRAIAKRDDIRVHVLFHCRVGCDEFYDVGFGRQIRWDIPLLDGYSHTFLSRSSKAGGLKPAVVLEILRRKPDVLLAYGYNSATNIAAMLAAKIVGARILVRGDTRLSDHHDLHGWKAKIKKRLFRFVDGFVAIGSLNKKYYEAHGVPPARIFFSPFAVSNASFRLGQSQRSAARESVRARLGLTPKHLVVLFVSKMIPLKRGQDLIDAFAAVADAAPAHLVFVGTGPEEPALRARANSRVPGRASFVGFQNQSQVPAYYAASDIFVFPTSGDSWGLVLNEAMAAGLPVIASDGAGAAPDLVASSGAGYVYRSGDVASLSSVLRRLVESEELRVSMGKRAQEHIAAWDASKSAEGMVDAVWRALRARGAPQ